MKAYNLYKVYDLVRFLPKDLKLSVLDYFEPHNREVIYYTINEFAPEDQEEVHNLLDKWLIENGATPGEDKNHSGETVLLVVRW